MEIHWGTLVTISDDFLLTTTFRLSSGFYNKLPWTGLLISNANLFITVLKAESSRSNWVRLHVCWGLTSLFLDGVFSLCDQLVERAKELFKASFIVTLISFMRALHSWLMTSQRSCLQIPSHLRLWFGGVNIRGELRH
jgi:hypothetical protein